MTVVIPGFIFIKKINPKYIKYIIDFIELEPKIIFVFHFNFLYLIVL